MSEATNAASEGPARSAVYGGNVVYQRLLGAFRSDDSESLHMESLLCALGSLAGYACQEAVRKNLVEGRGWPEERAFLIAECPDGYRYFLGDHLNRPLAEDPHSVWALAAEAARRLGAERPVDLEEIFEHVSRTIGGADFGRPRLPDGRRTSDTPRNYVKNFWPQLQAILSDLGPAEQWPVMLGIAAQLVIQDAKDTIEPSAALAIVMESAVAMSKLDLRGTS